MNSRPLMRLRLETTATEEIGSTPNGKLSIFPITGGSFEGERLRGKVLAGGGDWVTAKADGTLELDARITLETDDGASSKKFSDVFPRSTRAFAWQHFRLSAVSSVDYGQQPTQRLCVV